MTPEDRGYRRGFDQGVAALAHCLGISDDDLQASAYKQRVKAFRSGTVPEAASLWKSTPQERNQLLNLLISEIKAAEYVDHLQMMEDRLAVLQDKLKRGVLTADEDAQIEPLQDAIANGDLD